MNLEKDLRLQKWLAEHNYVLDESFSAALRKLSRKYQAEHGIRTLNEVYQKIGVKKEYLYYWQTHPHNTQTKKF